MLEQPQLALPPLLPLLVSEAVGLGLELGQFLLLLLSSHLRPFRQVNDLPVSSHLLLNVLVSRTPLVLIFVVFSGLLGLLIFEHS